jgi:glycosyltransferase involved in cell wall biosynthesis
VSKEAIRRNADVIVETQVGCSDSGAVAARLTDLPLFIDDCTPSSEEDVLGAGLPWVARQTLARLGNAATTVVAVTEAMRNLLVAEGIEKEKIRIIPNGASLQPADESKRTAVRRQLGIDEAIVIGYVGSFQPWHRVDLLVEAFALLRHLPHLHLLLMGEGVERSKVENSVRHHDLDDRVSFHGAVPPDDVASFISALDIGVMPGTNPYGHPMKIIEYAAAGCVPVAPDLPVIREILDDGETGVLFASANAEALMAAIEELCLKGDFRRRLGAAARQRIALPSSWERRAKYLASCLYETVQRKLNATRN